MYLDSLSSPTIRIAFFSGMVRDGHISGVILGSYHIGEVIRELKCLINGMVRKFGDLISRVVRESGGLIPRGGGDQGIRQPY